LAGYGLMTSALNQKNVTVYGRNGERDERHFELETEENTP
jgi:hypothetical protein